MTSLRRPALAGVLLSLAVAAPAAANGVPSVVADGLSNPRGMAFGSSGTLYVAESGRGGDGACITGPEGSLQCYGATGAITGIDVKSGRKRTLIGGLPSIAAQAGETPGADATGPNDVAIVGGRAYFVVGLGADPALRSQLGPVGRRFASLYRYGRYTGVRKLADIGRYETDANPDGGAIDSNPFSVDANGRRLAVTDAGGNALLGVTRFGRIRTSAVFPGGVAPAPPGIPGLPEGTPVPYQAVPTGVTRARPDGPPLVGQLTGFPFPAGAAKVFEVPAGAGGTPVPVLDGFSVVVDVAAGRDGSVWVLQIASGTLAGPPTPGRLFRVAPDGTRTEYAAGVLQQPTGLALSLRGDAVYVANNGGSPDAGTILRVPVER